MRRVIIGIDEAGRGPLAGPVAIGAVLIPLKSRLSFKGIADSKALSKKEREVWFEKIRAWQKEEKLFYAISLISHRIIDKKGIVPALRLGITRSLKKLNINPHRVEVLLDGALRAPDSFPYQKTIIRGDEKIPAISLASIVAKVTRDRRMEKLGLQFPEYGFAKHKGYGTKNHQKRLKKYGISEIHRKSFLRNFDK
jgi:ribonuclease HII